MFLALPFLFGSLLMVSMLVLSGLVYWGFTPDGERVSIRLEGACVEAARPQVEARIAALGLGAPSVSAEGSALLIEATLPGQDVDRERTVLPGMLGQAGMLEVRDGDEVVLDRSGVTGASLQLDENGAAMAVLELSEAAAKALDARVRAAPEGRLSIWLDGVQVADRPNTMLIDGTSLRVIGADQTPRARMAAAADQIIVLENGPLPCALAVGSVVAVGSAD